MISFGCLKGNFVAALAIAAAMGSAQAQAESPFANRVMEYAPAPGQFVDNPVFNDPARALGPPSGAGTSAPNNESLVSLGGFGGFVVLGFDHTIEDHPLNPLGLDAIVFGNAYWVGGNQNRHWAECATIEISRDDNANGIADDAWFLIPGSHLLPPLIPTAHVWNGGATTYAYALPDNPFAVTVVVNPLTGSGEEGIFGYAEYSPTLVLGDMDADNVLDDAVVSAEEFYTVPDDPFAVGVTAGSGGGDAFDIKWAVDPATGDPASLDGFDFVRITTPTHYVVTPIGEKSAEIDAVSDVTHDPAGDADSDEDIDLFDFAQVQLCIGMPGNAEECAGLSMTDLDALGLSECALMIERWTGPL